MTTLEDAVDFFNSYLDVDYAGNKAVFLEGDEAVNTLRENSMKFWHSEHGVPLSPSFGRTMGMTPEQLNEMAAKVNLARREIFLAAEYSDPIWRTLYAAYVGGDRVTTARSYSELLYAAEIQDEIKIIASYREDINKVSPPVHWRHSQGAEISLSGPPLAVIPLQEPTGRKAHQQDWEMNKNAVRNR
ncbi:hypothetical protein AB0E67_18665 [Streptomyces sp. NPDC032161]|uniref:hypothetical protein n=1 Tax=unclassified Streptomyces TaxID=2593676 RepID=UPI003406042B